MPIPEDFGGLTTAKNKKVYDLLPADVYQVRITGLELRKEKVYQQPGLEEDKINFEFTINEEGQYKGRKLWQSMRPNMTAGFAGGQPSWLYKLFCAVNNISLTDDEASNITAKNINELLNKEVRVVVKQKTSQTGNQRNNIVDFMPLKQGAASSVDAAQTPPSASIEEAINVDDIPF